ncbi:hypothetical protein CRYUN_Cryun37aG0027700 [Craigia yunnanensis]
MSLDISFSELIDQGRTSNIFETENLDSMQLLQEILPRKKIELASSEMELDSSRKKFFKNFKTTSNSKHTTTSNQSRLKTDVSADSIVKQEHLFSKFRNEGASSSKEALKKSGVIISHPRSKACSGFCKGECAWELDKLEAEREYDITTDIAGLFEVIKFGNELLTFIIDSKDPKACMALLRGASKDSMSVTRNIIKNLKLVPGGGVTELTFLPL